MLMALSHVVWVIGQHLFQSIPALVSRTPSRRMYATANNHHGDHKHLSYSKWSIYVNKHLGAIREGHVASPNTSSTLRYHPSPWWQENPVQSLLQSNIRFSASGRLVTAESAARQPRLWALVAAAARRQQPLKA